MIPEHLQSLEQLCDAAVPAEYLALLDAYPSALKSALRADDGSDSEGQVSDVELIGDSADILNINREVRQGTIFDPEGQEFRWPNQLLVIGETGDGDYYCLDTDGEHPGVLQFRHYSVEFEVIADSLEDFVDMLMQAYVERSTTDDEDGDEDEEDEEETEDGLDDSGDVEDDEWPEDSEDADNE